MGESREWYALVLPGQTWPQRGCGWRRPCTCCLELQTFVAFDQPLQRLNALVEELEIPEVQRILPSMLADGHALAALRSLLVRVIEVVGYGRHLPAVLRRSRVLSDGI